MEEHLHPQDTHTEHTHEHNSGGNNNLGAIILAIVLLAIVFLFFYLAIPALKSSNGSAPQINVPSKIDVNLNK